MSARVVRYQGRVTLGLIVDKDGLPQQVHILSPLGVGLDAQAVHTVEGWRFKPAERDGQPVNVEIAVEVDFHLDDRTARKQSHKMLGTSAAKAPKCSATRAARLKPRPFSPYF